MSDQDQTLLTLPESDAWLKKAQRCRHFAMATEFEIIIMDQEAVYAQQAAHAAFCELDRLEGELSRFLNTSDVARINALRVGESVQVGLDTYACLEHCVQMYAETHGAFDISIGPLYRCWLNTDKTIRAPSADELRAARTRTGLHLVQLDSARHRVQVLQEGVHLDLGGYGKGYAIDRVVELLGEWDIGCAFIHGGTSTAYGLGRVQDLDGWPVTLSNPQGLGRILQVRYLCNQALSGSGVQKGRHIIDPRSARPAQGRLAAWALAPDAATSDALSTAFMIMSDAEIETYLKSHPEIRACTVPWQVEGRCGKPEA